jgi:Osmosensitive K+ channel His kinase sensor domain
MAGSRRRRPLARHPGLLLVDEYAHTNVSGSRRWQDIEELLDAGIMNIQHLESLNDVVQKITRVRVRRGCYERPGRFGLQRHEPKGKIRIRYRGRQPSRGPPRDAVFSDRSASISAEPRD